MSESTRTIQSIERAFAVLEVISLCAEPLSLQQLTAMTGITKTTLHGILKTLAVMGYVDNHRGCYCLGLRIRELSKPLESHDEALRREFQPLLQKMAVVSQSISYLAVPCGSREYLYLDAYDGDMPLVLRSPRGVRESLTTSAIGKVLLAFKEDLRRNVRLAQLLSPTLEHELITIQQQGYALDLEQVEPGLNCVALPLYVKGTLVAAMGISGAASALPVARLIELVHIAQLPV